MTTLLNIGLQRNDGRGDNRAVEVLAELPNLLITDLRLVQSHTERTLVVQINSDGTWITDLCQRLCLLLAQDCIGVWHVESDNGVLVGPKANEWGPFSDDKFFLPNTLTLAEEKAAHANLSRGIRRQ